MRTDTFPMLPYVHINWVIAGFAALFLLWALFLIWRWRATRVEAADVYAAKREYGELAAHVDEASFTQSYMRSEAPRAATYLFICAFICAMALPPAMLVFSNLWDEVWSLTGELPEAARGTLVHTFSTFLACMGVMVGVLAVAMHRFHTRTPPSLRTAIRQLNGSDT